MLTFIVLGALATHRLTILANVDEITAPIRERILDRWPPMPTSPTYVLTCPWCMSIWMAVAVVGAYSLLVAWPGLWVAGAAVLAFSSVTGLLDEMG